MSGLPVAPLLVELQRRADREGSWRAVAERISVRFGTSWQTEHRAIMRLLAAQAESLTPVRADRWACGIGLHPQQVWGDVWFAGVTVDLDGEAAA